MQFSTVYSIFGCVSLILSYLLNGALVYIVHKRRERVGFYRHFTYAFVVVDVLYSTAFSTALPFWYTGRGEMGFFSAAPWNDYYALIQISYQVWFAFFVAVLLCIACSFMYRYGLLCSPFIVSLFERTGRFILTLLVLVSMNAFLLFDTNYLMFENSEFIRSKLQLMFGETFTTNFTVTYVLTVDLNDGKNNIRSAVGALSIVLLVQSIFVVMGFCGWKIHKTIKTRVMSDKLKGIHSRALNKLIAQTINPLCFLFFPCSFNLLSMFADADFGDLPKVLAHLLGLFPIINPIIVICFTEDYKRFLFGTTSSISIPAPFPSSLNVSNVHTNEIRHSRGTASVIRQ